MGTHTISGPPVMAPRCAPSIQNRRQAAMKKPFYKVLYVQVLFAIACGVLLGYFG